MVPRSIVDLQLLLPAFFLVVFRVSGIVLTSPILGSGTIPRKLKIGFVLGVSLATFPLLAPTMPAELSLPMVVGGAAGELLIGLTIGLGLSMILLATQMAGMIVGQQAGLALANVFDPNTESQTSVLGTVYFWTASVVFLLMGGHRAMMRCLLDSFQAIPPMSFSVDGNLILLFSELMMMSIRMAMQIAGPMVIALLLAKASLGFLSRTMPQLHILSVGFAIFVSLGLFLSALELHGLGEILFIYLADAFEMIRAVLGLEEAR